MPFFFSFFGDERADRNTRTLFGAMVLFIAAVAGAAPTDGYVQYANTYTVQNWTTNVGSGYFVSNGIIVTVAQYGDSRCELRWKNWPDQNNYNQFEFDALFDNKTQTTAIHQIKSNTGGEPIYLQVSTPGSIRNDNGSVFLTGMANTWFHVNSFFNPVNGDGRVYVNGQLKVTRSYPTTDRAWYFKNGCYNNGLPPGGISTAFFKNLKNWVLATNPPAAPTGLVATPGISQVTLAWSASTSGAIAYNVKRATNPGGPYSLIATPAVNGYTNTGLANGTTYYYVVSATNSFGESPNSSEVNATPIDPGFSLSATPPSQPVTAGNSTNFTIIVVTNGLFAGSVNFGATGLPLEATAQFVPPSLSDAGNATLTIQTTTNTPGGTFSVAIFGTNVNGTITTAVSLVVSNGLSQPGTLIWRGTNNWSTPQNWTNLSVGGLGPPGPLNDVQFQNDGSAGAAGATNNIVDAAFAAGGATIRSLRYGNTNGFHTTLITPGTTLTVSNAASGNALFAGTGTDSGANETVTATMTGAGGALVVNNSLANVNIRQGGAAGTHQATLNLSGLDSLTATAARLLIAGDGATAVADSRLSGVLFLARTNIITLSGAAPQLNIGDHPSNGRGNPAITMLPSYLFLGRSNAIFADSITVGRQKAVPVSMLFNPAFVGSGATALFRGTNGPASRVSTWSIGDDSPLATSNQASEGTNDFTGGTVDAMIDTLYVGRGEIGSGNAAGSGTGTLTFNAGTIDVNQLEVGYQSQAGSLSAGFGTVNVNGSAYLTVNSALRLAFTSGGTAGAGTLNVNGGSASANNIVAGGGVSVIMATAGGTVSVGMQIGTPASRLAALNLTNGTLQLNVNGAAIVTNVSVNTLNVGGLNTLLIDLVDNVSGTTTFPLISYNTLNGSVAGNFVLGDLPDGVSGGLVDNPANKRIDLVLTPTAVVAPQITSATIAGSSLIMSGTNGAPYGKYYVLASTNLSVPLENWMILATYYFDGAGAFSFTNAMDPSLPQRFYLLQLP
jgi:hypothetical protein